MGFMLSRSPNPHILLSVAFYLSCFYLTMEYAVKVCASSSLKPAMARGSTHPMSPSTNTPQQSPAAPALYCELPPPRCYGATTQHLSPTGAAPSQLPLPGHRSAELMPAGGHPSLQKMHRHVATVSPAAHAAVREPGKTLLSLMPKAPPRFAASLDAGAAYVLAR